MPLLHRTRKPQSSRHRTNVFSSRSAASGLFKNTSTRGLFPLLLPGGVARVTGGLAFGLERGFSRGGLFLFPGELSRSLGSEPFFLGFLRRLLGLAGFPRLGPRSGLRLALRLALLYRRIVGTRLGAKFFQNGLFGLLGRFLPVGEAGFPESAHVCRVRVRAVVVMCGHIAASLRRVAQKLTPGAGQPCWRMR